MSNLCEVEVPVTLAWSTLSGDTRRDQAVAQIEDALRARRAAYAAYGRALLEADYATPQEVREARYAQLRANVAAGEAALDEALIALEELL